MLVVTAVAGFIGSFLVDNLNNKKVKDVVIVYDFTKTQKIIKYDYKKYSKKNERDEFILWLKENHKFVQFVFHLGASFYSTEPDTTMFYTLSLHDALPI